MAKHETTGDIFQPCDSSPRKESATSVGGHQLNQTEVIDTYFTPLKIDIDIELMCKGRLVFRMRVSSIVFIEG